MPNKFQRSLINLSILTISVILFLVTGEIASRIYAVFTSEIFQTIPIPEDIWNEYNSTLGWKHIPGKILPDKWGNKSVIINSHGFRVGSGRENRISSTLPHKKTIIALGDSFTFGHRMAAEENWKRNSEIRNGE